MTRLIFLLFACITGINTLSAQGPKYLTHKDVDPKIEKMYLEAKKNDKVNDIKALDILQKIIDKEPKFIDPYVLKTTIHVRAKSYFLAEETLQKLVALDSFYNSQALYTLAVCQWEQDKFMEAAPNFKRVAELQSTPLKIQKRSLKYLQDCIFSDQAHKHPVPFAPVALGTGINTVFPEYLPSFLADETMVIFTRLTNNDQNLYMSKISDNIWQEAIAIEELNTPDNEAAQTMTPDGKTMIFTRCGARDGLGSCDLYITENVDGKWTRPQNLGPDINTNAWESQPSLSSDGQTLYFVSDKQNGHGGRDIYYSIKQANGKWGIPKNIGMPVNTEYDDETPFIHPDNQTLYFMSYGHPGMGDFDVFYSRVQPNGKWGEPVNLGYPINTKDHEGGIVVSLDGKNGYISSDRKDDRLTSKGFDIASGNMDIYRFELYAEARPKSVTYLKVLVIDADTKEPVDAAIEIHNNENDQKLVHYKTGKNGVYVTGLPVGKDYGLFIGKEGYVFYSDHFALKDTFSAIDPFLLKVELKKASETSVAGNEPVVLKNIFFESNSAVLLKQSDRELQNLKSLLTQNPKMKIRIEGHTDNVGKDTDNQKLSEMRAKSVFNWLVEKGIPSDRLSFVGYGETKPISDNGTTQGRQLNRRTVFTVISNK